MIIAGVLKDRRDDMKCCGAEIFRSDEGCGFGDGKGGFEGCCNCGQGARRFVLKIK